MLKENMQNFLILVDTQKANEIEEIDEKNERIYHISYENENEE